MQKRIIDFGKIDYNSKGRKNCPVDLEVSLYDRDGIAELSICCNVWNPRKTDIYCGGQCLDEVKKYFATNMLFMELFRYWKMYHLNCMHAGTEEQEAALADFNGTYEEKCVYLKDLGLYEVEYNGKPYHYGSGWLSRIIPEKDLTRIKKIIGGAC